VLLVVVSLLVALVTLGIHRNLFPVCVLALLIFLHQNQYRLLLSLDSGMFFEYCLHQFQIVIAFFQ